MSESISKVTVYTDGAAAPNPGAGGYGALLLKGDDRQELSGGFALTTNNRMEIFSVIASLESLETPSQVNIYSDSKYVVNAVMKGWAERWRVHKGWKTPKEKAKNWDLWLRYFEAAEPHSVMMMWVKGHAGLPGNEEADGLAVAGAALIDNPDDEGYLAQLAAEQANQTMDLF